MNVGWFVGGEFSIIYALYVHVLFQKIKPEAVCELCVGRQR